MPRADKTTMSSTNVNVGEHRRSNKPVMEKKRRARINVCLNELKSLLMEAMRKDPTRHSKLEKADILEMTVKHLQDMQSMRRQLAVMAASSVDSAAAAVVSKYRAGFNECATEVARYVTRIGNDGLGPSAKQRLLVHLANSMSSLPSNSLMSASTTISAMAAARSASVGSSASSAQLRLTNGSNMAALLLPSAHSAALHADWSRAAANIRTAAESSIRRRDPHGINASSSSVNCCQIIQSPVMTSSEEDQGFVTSSGTEDRSSCSSGSNSGSEDVVCIDDDSDNNDDDGFVGGHYQYSADVAQQRRRDGNGQQLKPVVPVNLSKDVDKMWRPW